MLQSSGWQKKGLQTVMRSISRWACLWFWKEHGLHNESSMSFTSKSSVDSKDEISSKEAKIQIKTMGVRQRENKGSSREDSCPKAGKDGKRKEAHTACMHMCLKGMFKGPNTIYRAGVKHKPSGHKSFKKDSNLAHRQLWKCEQGHTFWNFWLYFHSLFSW